MSGFEVAGLVLGALPILIEAVKSYKNGIQTSKIFFRKKAVVNKLTLALLLQQETLAQIIKAILTQSGCNNIPEFDETPYKCLADAHVQENVLAYLGSSNLYVLNETLGQSYDTVRLVARNITHLVPMTEVRLNVFYMCFDVTSAYVTRTGPNG